MSFHFKSTVRMSPALAAIVVFKVISDICSMMGYDVWLTSANDGQHKVGSLHYQDKAWDFRTHHLLPQDKKEIVKALKKRLEPQFDVLFEYEGTENEHVHIEYDPKS